VGDPSPTRCPLDHECSLPPGKCKCSLPGVHAKTKDSSLRTRIPSTISVTMPYRSYSSALKHRRHTTKIACNDGPSSAETAPWMGKANGTDARPRNRRSGRLNTLEGARIFSDRSRRAARAAVFGLKEKVGSLHLEPHGCPGQEARHQLSSNLKRAT